MCWRDFTDMVIGYRNRTARQQDHDRILMRRLVFLVAGAAYGKESPFSSESEVFPLHGENPESELDFILANYPDPEESARQLERINKALES